MAIGSATTVVEINGVHYEVEETSYGFRLVSERDRVYDVTLTDRGTWECNCPSFVYRDHASLVGCKHAQKLRSEGFLKSHRETSKMGATAERRS
jgi:hypothetical protein